MQKLALRLLVLIPLTAAADSRLVPEDVLNAWGYETVSVDAPLPESISSEPAHKVRSIKPLPDRDDPYYPRFYLWRECLSGDSEAVSRKRDIEEDIAVRRSKWGKDYRSVFLKGNCVYFLFTDAEIFHVEAQPQLFESFKAFIFADGSRAGIVGS